MSGRAVEGNAMTDNNSFAKLVPGFDFLQGLVKNAGAALPTIGQWVAPTLDPEELQKRIEELRTVQFWLEQNARMLGATIQAMEVQRMTLSTLKTMNVQMEDLRDSMQLRMPGSTPPGKAKDANDTLSKDRAETPPPSVVDPMQWWGALTQQFTQLATSAMKDNAASAATDIAGNLVRQGIDAAGAAIGSKPVATQPAAARKSGKAPSKKAATRP